jgi:hypothetical protein
MARVVVVLKVIGITLVAVLAFLIATDQVDEAVTITMAIGSGVGSVFGNIAEFISELARRAAKDG